MSHSIYFEAIAQKLAANKHQVTFRCVGEMGENQNGVKHEVAMKPEIDIFTIISLSPMNQMKLIQNEAYKAIDLAYNETLIQDTLNHRSNFDLIMMDRFFSEAFAPLAKRIDVPMISISSTIQMPLTAWSANVPFYYFFNFHGVSQPNSFIGRMINFLDLSKYFFVEWKMKQTIKNWIHKFYTKQTDDVNFNNFSMLFDANSDFSFTTLPSTPNSIHIGCSHCRPSTKLPKELESIMANSGEHGVIFFSIGSLVNTELLPKHFVKKIVNVLSKLPQKILWQGKLNETNLTNFHFFNWLPQQDVLAHPKVKLALIQGGFGTVQEATYHACPIIGFPITLDRFYGVNQAVVNGYGEQLDLWTFTQQQLMLTINKILNNTRYKEKAVLASRRMQDVLMNPAEEAVFWTEYVIRHKGAYFLQPQRKKLKTANKMFCCLLFIFCDQFVLQIQSEVKNPHNKCEIHCNEGWSEDTNLRCSIRCSGFGIWETQTSYINRKCSLKDGLGTIAFLNHYTEIYSISFSNNNIYQFSTKYFCSINEYRLKKLILKNSKLNDSTKLGLGDINKCEDDNSKCDINLDELYLGGNPLEILRNNSFCYLTDLINLYLQSCSINSIEVDAFKLNRKLHLLNLNDNELTKIPYLEHLVSLRDFSIGRNLISSITNELLNSNALKNLDLSNNRIDLIEDNAFDQLINLIELDLSHNKLTKINPLFKKLNINSLKLSGNLLIEFSMLDFSSSLKYLFATHNLITHIPANLSNSQLEIIYLDYNKIKSINELHLPMTMEIMTFDGNEMQHFSIHPLNAKTKLKIISLWNNKLQIMTNDGFKANIYSLIGTRLACSCENSWLFNTPNEVNSIHEILTEVEVIDLNSNRLETFDFSKTPKTLTTLYLGNNLIKVLTPFSHEIFHLTFIDLSRNLIQNSFNFSPPTNLVTIDLSHNKINQLLISTTQPKKLKEINVANNSLRILPQTNIDADIFNLNDNPIGCNCQNSWLFNGHKQNKIVGQLCKVVNKFNPDNQITLSSNVLCESNYNNSNRCLIEHPIEYKFQCQFKCLKPCYCYTTDDFSIAHYYCSNSQLKFIPQWVHSDELNSQSEVIVWLNENNFNKIINDNFTDYDNVTQLYLKNSQITLIDPLTFEKMDKLIILDLSYNQLITIKDGTFNQQIYLEILILSHNLIDYLPNNWFNGTMALKSLQLHNNKLTNYSIENLRNRPYNLRELTLYNNNWTCNCSFIIEFQNYLLHNLYSVQKPHELYCTNEYGNLATLPVTEYNTSHCTDQQQQLITIDNPWPIVIGVVVPLCVFAIVYGVIRGIKSCVRVKRAKQIERAYRLMKNAGTPMETDGKVFDVFISYSNEDSDFVATKILPKLEDIKDPYHVCVHERNFLGGGSIEDTIIETIKKSTRIIVILTENYLQSDWCMYEFIIAHSVMIEYQCPRVVLIIKDELPPDINPNLQIYLSTNTYIEWTDQIFWQRLHFALSSNKLPMEQTLQPMNFLMSTRFIMPDD
ncbi:TOLL-like receptor [Chamberlinius hualienensis]